MTCLTYLFSTSPKEGRDAKITMSHFGISRGTKDWAFAISEFSSYFCKWIASQEKSELKSPFSYSYVSAGDDLDAQCGPEDVLFKINISETKEITVSGSECICKISEGNFVCVTNYLSHVNDCDFKYYLPGTLTMSFTEGKNKVNVVIGGKQYFCTVNNNWSDHYDKKTITQKVTSCLKEMNDLLSKSKNVLSKVRCF